MIHFEALSDTKVVMSLDLAWKVQQSIQAGSKEWIEEFLAREFECQVSPQYNIGLEDSDELASLPQGLWMVLEFDSPEDAIICKFRILEFL